MIDEHDFVMTDEAFESIKHSIHDELLKYHYGKGGAGQR